jgi:ABC-type branched-subunit amino acid transport system substrate-binding protein
MKAELKHLLFILLLSPFILLTIMACAGVRPVVKVGLVGPFEGQNRAIGYDAIYSAQLAVRQVNQAGGIAGYDVALVALDDSANPELAAQTAASLVIDPAVVAVVGHWLPETTNTAAPIYAEAGLPFIAAGAAPFLASDPALLPDDFRVAYEAVTPFDEAVGPYAAPAYDAFQLLWRALEKAKETNGPMNRAAVGKALIGLEYEGLAGTVYQP